MKAIELFPYWADNRALLSEAIKSLTTEELEFGPAVGLKPLGEILRHVITTEEYWWHGGILGEQAEAWRPLAWDTFTDAQKAAHRAARFPTVASILGGLEAAHEPVAEFLETTDAAVLCEKRRSAWGEDNTLRWMVWHLVEHDQHHRAQAYTRLRLLGHEPPPSFPRQLVMGFTPAGAWRPGEDEVRNIVPFWNSLRSTLREAVAGLTQEDLAFKPAGEGLAQGLASIHDIILHIFIWEDFLIPQRHQDDVAGWGKSEGWFWKSAVDSLAENVGEHFPSVPALLNGLDSVGEATNAFIGRLTLSDLTRTYQTPWGPQTLHHRLWYAREHMVHHRAQLFLRMRMIGRMPPEL
jgi:uncharacterized damage-inducible protein DinB